MRGAGSVFEKFIECIKGQTRLCRFICPVARKNYLHKIGACGILSNRVIHFRWLRHGWRGRHANDRGADATSAAANPLAKRRYCRIGDVQQHADATIIVTAAPTTNAGYAAEQ